MIKFTLKCGEDHRFDAWFRSNADFLEQQTGNIIACPTCGNTSVSKGLMTPSVPIKSNKKSDIVVPAMPTPEAAEPSTNITTHDPAIATADNNSIKSSQNMVPAAQAAPSSQPSDNPQNIANPLASMPPELREKVVLAVRQWRDAVVASSENVGKSFAEEARKIHYKEAKERPILGEASLDEIQDLLDEGIECAPLPILPEDHN